MYKNKVFCYVYSPSISVSKYHLTWYCVDLCIPGNTGTLFSYHYNSVKDTSSDLVSRHYFSYLYTK